MLKKTDHLGIAVHSIEQARPFHENVLGLSCEKVEEVASQKIRTAFFVLGETHIELLWPTADDIPIAGFLAKHGEGLHHVASYHSTDLETHLQLAKDNGCTLLHETPITGAGNKQIAFLHPKSSNGVLTEFCSGVQQ